MQRRKKLRIILLRTTTAIHLVTVVAFFVIGTTLIWFAVILAIDILILYTAALIADEIIEELENTPVEPVIIQSHLQEREIRVHYERILEDITPAYNFQQESLFHRVRRDVVIDHAAEIERFFEWKVQRILGQKSKIVIKGRLRVMKPEDSHEK